jgi:acyl-CoA thioesterase I
MLMCAGIAANAAPVRIVAIGASNTHGWYVGNKGAYPAQLEAPLAHDNGVGRRFLAASPG